MKSLLTQVETLGVTLDKLQSHHEGIDNSKYPTLQQVAQRIAKRQELKSNM